MLITTNSFAENAKEYYSYSKVEISKAFHKAAKIDGFYGLTAQEIAQTFGKSDLVSDNSNWENGKLHKYQLSDGRTLEIDILNGNVVHAVIITKGRDILLVWK